MNLQKIRLQLTALYALLAALAVGVLAWIAISTGSDGIFDSAEREAENVVRELALTSLWPPAPDDFDESAQPFNTWRVNSVDEWRNPFGNAWVEPPLFTIADNALRNGGPIYAEFESDGAWLAYAEPMTEENHVIVTRSISVGSRTTSVRSGSG